MLNRTLIIVLNWNGTEDTLACLESLSNIKDTKFDILLIDNNSEPHQFNLLKDNILYPNCQSHSFILQDYGSFFSSINYYIHNEIKIFVARAKDNYGFARSCNFGAELAHQNHYKYILFLNNDTVVEDDFLSKMLEALNINKADGVIPQIRFESQREIIWNCGGKIDKFGRRKYFYDNKNINEFSFPAEFIDVSFVTGCCLLFKTDYFIKIGKFSERFFFGEEDIELSLRLLRLNSKLICDTRALIYHKVGASIQGDGVKHVRKAYIHYLNRYVNMKISLGLWWPLWLVPSSLKVIKNLIFINKISFGESLVFLKCLIVDSVKSNSVSKEKFERLLSIGYKTKGDI
ncbi:glycosyltransferase [Mixta calida]|uniref:glycosyltransferase n=1 Tax=Mixta calida TaxID=665913 RepID=UPI00403A9C50